MSNKIKVKVDCKNCLFYDQVIKEKDQRISELEKANQTTVKEFADELKNKIENDTYILTNLNIDETYCGNKVTKQELFEFIISDLLKEKGIE